MLSILNGYLIQLKRRNSNPSLNTPFYVIPLPTLINTFNNPNHYRVKSQINRTNWFLSFDGFLFKKHHTIFLQVFSWVCLKVIELVGTDKLEFTANSDSDDGYKLSDDEIVEEKQESKQEDPIDFPELVNDDDGEEEGESNAMEKESGQTKRIRSPGKQVLPSWVLEALAKKKEKFAEMKVNYYITHSLHRDVVKSAMSRTALPLTLSICHLWNKQPIFGLMWLWRTQTIGMRNMVWNIPLQKNICKPIPFPMQMTYWHVVWRRLIPNGNVSMFRSGRMQRMEGRSYNEMK